MIEGGANGLALSSLTARRRLFVIYDVDTHGPDLERLGPVIQALLARAAPGTIALVERDPRGRDDRARLGRLRLLRAWCDASAAALVVSARVDLALAAGADGVQLPERGLPAAAVAAWVGATGSARRLAIGRSCHDRAGLLEALAQGANWAFLSPVFAPHSKPLAGPPLGVSGFAAAVAGITLPVVALGGVLPAHVPDLTAAGARGVATLGAVLGTADPAASAGRFVEALAAGRPSPEPGRRSG